MSWDARCCVSDSGNTPEQTQQSSAGQSVDTSTSDLSRTITATGTATPDTVVNMVLAPFVNVGAVIDGVDFTPNLDGSITCNSDMGLIEVACMVNCHYSASDTVVLGIGVGDPLDLPVLPGLTSVGGTYVSRFVDAKRGGGNSRNQTLALNYFAVGRTQTIAANAGDKIFPLLWTEDTGPVSVVCNDFIFAIRALRYVL